MQENTGGYIVNETGDIWLNVDTDANSGAGTMVIGSNLTSTNATHQFDFTEAYANFRRGNDLRLRRRRLELRRGDGRHGEHHQQQDADDP